MRLDVVSLAQGRAARGRCERRLVGDGEYVIGVEERLRTALLDALSWIAAQRPASRG